jgi:hypothetical protein
MAELKLDSVGSRKTVLVRTSFLSKQLCVQRSTFLKVMK